MNELSQREKLLKEQQALQELLDEHLFEVSILKANIEQVNRLITDLDAGLDENPLNTYKKLYNLDQAMDE